MCDDVDGRITTNNEHEGGLQNLHHRDKDKDKKDKKDDKGKKDKKLPGMRSIRGYL